ncbi:MAG: N-acetyltransferase family protein [Proteobacteria bacterium]|nr:N-acetyltransferase family protein [Pseudomonadota bacterium]
MTEIHIRRAVRADCSGILEIYNDAVLKTTATYDYEPRPLEHRVAWFDDHQRTGHAIFVAEASGGRIVGWSALNRYHDRMGFRFTAENSIYVAEGSRGQGLGARLLEPLIPAAAEIGIRGPLQAGGVQVRPLVGCGLPRTLGLIGAGQSPRFRGGRFFRATPYCSRRWANRSAFPTRSWACCWCWWAFSSWRPR